jgi:hypothetical protein
MALFRSQNIRFALAGMLGFEILTGLCSGQSSTWTLPGSGFVYDAQAGTIRPLVGFIGAAVPGTAVLDELGWASLGPNGKAALVQRADSLLWIPDLLSPDRQMSVEGIISPKQAAWSADSSRVVVLSKGSKLVWLKNAGESQTVEASWDLETLGSRGAAGVKAPWTLLAADASGDRVLVSTRTLHGWQLRMASRTLAPVTVPFAGNPVAAAFASSGAWAFIADAVAHQIWRLEGTGGTASLTPVISSSVYVDDPTGLALSADDSRLFIADRTARTIRIFDSGTTELLAELPLETSPHSLTAVSPGRYILNSGDRSTDPFLYLDTTNPARMVFVPRAQ